MKRLLWTLLLTTPLVHAQPDDMKGIDMNKMMQEAQKMQHCLAAIDQKELLSLARQGEAIEEKISALCQAGKRDSAVNEAMAFIEKMKSNPQLETLRQCGEKVSTMVPVLPLEQYAISEEQLTTHLCSNYQ